MTDTNAIRRAASDAIAIARTNIDRGDMIGSAKLCIADAQTCQDRSDHESAIRRAARSLEYSVGCLHSDFATVRELAQRIDVRV